MTKVKENLKVQEEKINKSNKHFGIAILVIIGLIAAVLLGVKLLKEDNSKYTYNNFPFEKESILWITYAEKDGQPYRVPFYYHPSELEDIVAELDIEQRILQAAENKPNTTVYVTLDPDLKSKAVVAAVEISRITGSRYNLLNLPTKGALTREPTDQLADTQNPIVTCDDADEDNIVIMLTISSASFIHEEDGCIVLEGKDEEDLLRVADRFAYMIIGIMN